MAGQCRGIPPSPILRVARHAGASAGRERPLPSQPRLRSDPNQPGQPARSRSSDELDAFSSLYEAYADRVYRYLLSRTGRPVDAEELTSRTFLNALSSLDTYRGGGGNFGSWLMTIAHNLLANWYRSRGRRPSTAPLDDAREVPADTPGPESSLENSERIARVRAAVRSLPADRQQLLALKYVEGCTNAEIGRRMGRTEGAIKALHHRTLGQLQEALGEP
jgi:RNA polymerase sigma-70 factor (ECF subfamily)